MSLLAIDVGSLSKGDDKREGRYMGMPCETLFRFLFRLLISYVDAEVFIFSKILGSWMSLVSDLLFQKCI